MSAATPDEMKALAMEARIASGFEDYADSGYTNGLLARLADALEAVYDAGRRELAERFANQDETRKAAIEELMAWEDEHEALSAHPGERFAFTDAEWREYQAMPEQGYSHRGKLEFFVNRWLSAHPAEETEWEYRRVTPAGNPRRDAIFESPPDLDEGWTMERRAVGPWSPVPEGSETA